MNVSGVGATPPPPPLPPVAPARPASAAVAPDERAGSGTSERRTEQHQDRPAAGSAAGSARPEAPPLRMITVTEMRVMLGQLPASAAVKLEQHTTSSH